MLNKSQEELPVVGSEAGLLKLLMWIIGVLLMIIVGISSWVAVTVTENKAQIAILSAQDNALTARLITAEHLIEKRTEDRWYRSDAIEAHAVIEKRFLRNEGIFTKIQDSVIDMIETLADAKSYGPRIEALARRVESLIHEIVSLRLSAKLNDKHASKAEVDNGR